MRERVVGEYDGVEWVCDDTCGVDEHRYCPSDSCHARRRTTEEQSWQELIGALQDWADNHLDQWDKIRLTTKYGPVYVRIARESLYPDSYDQVPP